MKSVTGPVANRHAGFNREPATTESTGMDVAAELLAQAERGATGALDIAASDNRAQIVLRDGRVASVSAAGQTRPALGMRLVSGGCLSLTNLGAALNTARQHPQMRLGDVLVRMGLVQRHEVEAVAWEQMCDDVAAILAWPDPTSGFTALNPDTVPPPGPSVPELLAAAGERRQRWQQIVREIGGPDTVAHLADDAMGGKDVALRPTDWAVLCRVDGRRSLRSIAEQTGFTLMEAASILRELMAAGFATAPGMHLPPASTRPAVWPDPATTGPSYQPAAPAQTPSIPPAQPAPPPPPTAPAQWPVEEFDDPADLLRELSQLSGSEHTPRRRGSR